MGDGIEGKLYWPNTPDLTAPNPGVVPGNLEGGNLQSVGMAALNKRRQLLVSLATPATRHQLVEDGSYFLAQNPTPGTGEVFITALTAFTDNSPAFYIENIDTTANGGLNRSIYLDFLQLVTTAAAATATQQHFLVRIDTGHRTVTTGANMQVITPVVPNSFFPAMSSAAPSRPMLMPIIQVQNNAATPAYSASTANARNVGRGALGGLNIAGDELMIGFGTTDVGAATALTAAEGAGQPGRRVSVTPPVIISPGNNCSIYLWGVGQTAAYSPEFVLGMWAR